MVKDNQSGNINLPPGTPKWVAVSIMLAYLMTQLDGCMNDLEELPSSKDWQDLRWEKAPESPPEP